MEDLVSYRNILENVVAQAKATVLLLSSLVLNVGPTISIKNQISNLNSIKLIAIFVIFYKLVYQNNSNYLLFIIGLYLYSVRAYVDAFMLLNHLNLSVLYNIV